MRPWDMPSGILIPAGVHLATIHTRDQQWQQLTANNDYHRITKHYAP